MTLTILLLISVLCAFICHFFAKSRGANPVLWGVLGFVFGPFALPFVFFVRPRAHDA